MSVDLYQGYKNLSFARADGVLTVEINRPDARNAVNAELHEELSRVFADIRGDTETRAVVLTGAGKSFSAGGDLNWFQDMTDEQRESLFAEAHRIIIDLLDLPQPIIAAVNGAAIGVGATLALFCDLVIAADDAILGDPHVRVGLVAGGGGAIIWPWRVGVARAKQYLLTGANIEAVEAERIGLINEVVPADALRATAHKTAMSLANGPAKAIQGTKASVNRLLRESVDLVLETGLALERESFAGEDHREAVLAFLEHRAPAFNGR